MRDKSFYNTLNNIFNSQAEFDRIYLLVEEDNHESDKRLKDFIIEDGILFYRKDDKKAFVGNQITNKINNIIASIFANLTRYSKYNKAF